ncbi:hypothetical protein CAPTEDRAFT_222073 [Capitella teleta]|uniref:Uncharacterized protein n=1 Tax=Capitella teleta TaxID=283909 RepID=R7TCH0_CAPTE|nr:hypothetical protein CAPTEDRAFT_222073 [Capitella teleta]|eukprot:ELT91423.1 hypothetical protein CAPTEDRAFT_222073 [Capitella teleta]
MTLRVRRKPFVETEEIAGKTITLREASRQDAQQLLQLSREVYGPWDYYPSTLASFFNDPRARIYVAEHEGKIKTVTFELKLSKGKIEQNAKQVHLVKEKALIILQENSSALFPDNLILYSYLWIVSEPNRISFSEAYNSSNVSFFFSGPDHLSGVTFFDAVSTEAGTLVTAFCYTRDSGSQLVFEMLQSVEGHLQTTAQRDKPIRLEAHFPLSCDGDELMDRLTESGLVQKWCPCCVTECATFRYPTTINKHKL